MQLITEAKAGEQLQLAPNTLPYLRRTGQGPSQVRLGRRVYYTQAALDAWVAACTQDCPALPTSSPVEDADV